MSVVSPGCGWSGQWVRARFWTPRDQSSDAAIPGDIEAASAFSIMVGAGVLALIGQLCLTRAYSVAPAARVGAISYSSVVFAAILGWALWGETPTQQAMGGAVLVVAACILASWQQKRAAIPAAKD